MDEIKVRGPISMFILCGPVRSMGISMLSIPATLEFLEKTGNIGGEGAVIRMRMGTFPVGFVMLQLASGAGEMSVRLMYP